MENINERPVCHRAEDLVTYLYGEASVSEARDFAAHLERCDACRVEFSLFNQVHESIVTWRNDALGTATVPIASPVAQINPFVQPERKLSAWASLREFFSVSPMWLRGATAFAGLLLCALLVFAVSRFWQAPTEVVKDGNPEKVYTEQDFKNEVQKQLAAAIAAQDEQKGSGEKTKPGEQNGAPQLASNRARQKTRQPRLTQEEREQLAADLGLVPGRDEELPFVLPEEPHQ